MGVPAHQITSPSVQVNRAATIVKAINNDIASVFGEDEAVTGTQITQPTPKQIQIAKKTQHLLPPMIVSPITTQGPWHQQEPTLDLPESYRSLSIKSDQKTSLEAEKKVVKQTV